MKNHQLRFYSQHGEDYLLWGFFKQKSQGLYIDVGAFDGRYLSNTYSFYKAGWKGICVDANPEYFEFCTKYRQNDILINAVCSGTENTKVDFLCDPTGLYSSKISSPEKLDEIKARLEKNNIPNKNITSKAIPSITLDTILTKNLAPEAKIDFISIDVEGAELEVLKGFNIEKWHPSVIIIEANDDDLQKATLEYLDTKKYILARKLGVNLIFTQGKENALKLRNLPIRCAIEKVMHPKGADFTFPQYLEGHIIDTLKDKKNILLANHNKKLIRGNNNLKQRVEELNKIIKRLRTESI